MANDFYNRAKSFSASTKAKGSDVVSELDSVAAGFLKMPSLESIQKGATNFVTAGGTADALTITSPVKVITTYTGQDGLLYLVKAIGTNTGAMTVNVDGVGVVSLVTADQDAAAAGSVKINGIYTIIYNETVGKFVFTDEASAAVFADNAETSATASAASAATSADEADYSQDWAITPEDTLVPVAAGGDGSTDYSALHWAAKAAFSNGIDDSTPTLTTTYSSTKIEADLAAQFYTHPSDGVDPGAALTGANVFSDITVNAAGHVTGSATRAITLANLGYTGETNATADQTKTDIDALGVDAATLDDLSAATLKSGRKNLLINGSFRINQRGYVSATATTGANEYTLDRWRVVTSGQNITFSALGTDNTITCPAGGLEQEIEALNVYGGTYVISWTGTATCTVGGTARTDGESFTLTANTNAIVKFSGGTVKEAQLEPGVTATNFEQRPIGEELILCQRYYCLPQVCTTYNLSSYVNNSVGMWPVPFPVEMRVSPTLSVDTTGWSFGTTDTPTFNNGTKTAARFFVFSTGITGNAFVGGIGLGDFTADAEI